MSTPARKSGRQSKPTEKFKEYLYGSDETDVSSKKNSKSPIIGHTQISKEKPIKFDTTSLTTVRKRGRPRKSSVDTDSLKNKNNESESEDEDEDDNNDNETKGNKLKKDNIHQKKEVSRDMQLKKTSQNFQTVSSKLNSSGHPERKRGRPRKGPILDPQPECKSPMMTDTESEDEDIVNKITSNIGEKGMDKSSTRTVGSRISPQVSSESQESGPRRSGRPPKLNKRLLNYLHSDEGLLGESGHLSKKRKENSYMLSPKESESIKDDEAIIQKIRPRPVMLKPGPAVSTVRNTSIVTKKAIGRLKSISPEKSVRKEKKELITDIKKTMISRLVSMENDLSRKMLEDNTKTLLELASHSSVNLEDPFAALNLDKCTEDLDDETTEKILKWLVEEEMERQNYRRTLLESLKKSHEKSMEMFNQMLKALEAV